MSGAVERYQRSAAPDHFPAIGGRTVMATVYSTQPLEWRPVVGWEGFYEVSNAGRVRSIQRTIIGRDGVRQRFQSREMTLRSRAGYYMVHLRDTAAGRRQVALVHRLVAKAFIPNPKNLPCVNHIDCVPTNNRVENLEWCTQAENLAHSARLGRMRVDHLYSERSPNANLSDAQVRSIRDSYASGEGSFEQLAKIFSTNKRTVERIVKRKTYIYVQ